MPVGERIIQTANDARMAPQAVEPDARVGFAGIQASEGARGDEVDDAQGYSVESTDEQQHQDIAATAERLAQQSPVEYPEGFVFTPEGEWEREVPLPGSVLPFQFYNLKVIVNVVTEEGEEEAVKHYGLPDCVPLVEASPCNRIHQTIVNWANDVAIEVVSITVKDDKGMQVANMANQDIGRHLQMRGRFWGDFVRSDHAPWLVTVVGRMSRR